jgi:hypothetical protein
MPVAVCVGVNAITPDIIFYNYLFLFDILFVAMPAALITLRMRSLSVLMTTPSVLPIGTHGNGAPRCFANRRLEACHGMTFCKR